MEHLFGQYLIKNKIINQQQLVDAVEYQNSAAKPLGQIAVAREIMSHGQVTEVLTRIVEHGESFGEAAINMNLLDRGQLKKLLTIQRRLHLPLGDILVQQKSLSAEDMRTWLEQYETQRDKHGGPMVSLRRTALFSHLGDVELARIAELLQRQDVRPEDGDIYGPGDESRFFYLIESGTVKIALQGERMDVASLRAGEHFGLHGVLSHSSRSERAIPLTNCVLWKLPRDKITEVFAKHPMLAHEASRDLSRTMQRYFKKVYSRRDIDIAIACPPERVPFAVAVCLDIAAKEDGPCLIILPGKSRTFGGGSRRKGNCRFRRFDNKNEWRKIRRALEENPSAFRRIFYIMPAGNASRDYPDFVERATRRLVILKDESPEWPKIWGTPRVFVLEDVGRAKAMVLFRKCREVYGDFLVPRIIGHGDVALVTRWIVGPTFGIALGGGGARGLAHLGVLAELESRGITIDVVAGTSIGAIVGAQVAMGLTSDEIREVFERFWIGKRFHPFLLMGIPFTSPLRRYRLMRVLKKVLGETRGLETPIPFLPVSVDLESGREVNLLDTFLWKSVVASCACPGVLPVEHYKDLLLADGALINNVPGPTLKRYGVDVAVSVDVSPRIGAAPLRSESLPSIINRSLDIMIQKQNASPEQEGIIQIRPGLAGIRAFQYNSGPLIIERGRQAAAAQMHEITAALEASARTSIDGE